MRFAVILFFTVGMALPGYSQDVKLSAKQLMWKNSFDAEKTGQL